MNMAEQGGFLPEYSINQTNIPQGFDAEVLYVLLLKKFNSASLSTSEITRELRTRLGNTVTTQRVRRSLWSMAGADMITLVTKRSGWLYWKAGKE